MTEALRRSLMMGVAGQHHLAMTMEKENAEGEGGASHHCQGHRRSDLRFRGLHGAGLSSDQPPPLSLALGVHGSTCLGSCLEGHKITAGTAKGTTASKETHASLMRRCDRV